MFKNSIDNFISNIIYDYDERIGVRRSRKSVSSSDKLKCVTPYFPLKCVRFIHDGPSILFRILPFFDSRDLRFFVIQPFSAPALKM